MSCDLKTHPDLKSILPFGKVRMGLRQVIAMKSEQEFFVFGATAGEAIFLRLLLGK